jgi:hypothetical protein
VKRKRIQPGASGSHRSGGSWFEASPGKIVHETLSSENPSQIRAGGVAQRVGPEFKPRYWREGGEERDREREREREREKRRDSTGPP